MGVAVVHVYKDHGVSGAKGRDKRPQFDAMCKVAARREFDLVIAWSVDRLGRSLQDLVVFLGEMHATGRDLYLHQQGLDTTTPAGKAICTGDALLRMRGFVALPRAGGFICTPPAFPSTESGRDRGSSTGTAQRRALVRGEIPLYGLGGVLGVRPERPLGMASITPKPFVEAAHWRKLADAARSKAAGITNAQTKQMI